MCLWGSALQRYSALHPVKSYTYTPFLEWFSGALEFRYKFAYLHDLKWLCVVYFYSVATFMRILYYFQLLERHGENACNFFPFPVCVTLDFHSFQFVAEGSFRFWLLAFFVTPKLIVLVYRFYRCCFGFIAFEAFVDKSRYRIGPLSPFGFSRFCFERLCEISSIL